MTGSAWRWIEDGPGEGRANMAADHALLLAADAGRVAPTLRLYGWQRPTVSVGHFQDASRAVDWDRCGALGVPVVVRPTGGRALLHAHEITYSLAVPLPSPLFTGGLREMFARVAMGLVAALRALGVEGAEVAAESRGGLRSPACFATLNHGEICVGGRKLLASAQRRLKGAFLQHGSLPLELPGELGYRLFAYESDAARRAARDLLLHRTTALGEVLAGPVPPAAVSAAFRRGFEEAFGVSLEPGNWTAWERETARRLQRSAAAPGPLPAEGAGAGG